ncbi:MAG TPA: hypothetical protein VKU19_22010 [Bryobacteraceae bacterium]|nr:hypothetical protein [Bryobacteraceae bacterium]
MRHLSAFGVAVCVTAVSLFAQGQPAPNKEAQAKEAQAKDEAKGLPPRATPNDYQFHTQVGTVTMAAEFAGHTVPNPQGPLTTEDYVSVEIGLFGPPEAKLKISAEDFSLRVNGKKAALPSLPYGVVIGNVKDPEWEPPEKAEQKSKTSLNSGGQQDKPEPGAPPPVVHIPIEVQRAMANRVRKAALLEGDRSLPQAGLLFFSYHGRDKSIHSVELVYSGPAGKATLTLQ